MVETFRCCTETHTVAANAVQVFRASDGFGALVECPECDARLLVAVTLDLAVRLSAWISAERAVESALVECRARRAARQFGVHPSRIGEAGRRLVSDCERLLKEAAE